MVKLPDEEMPTAYNGPMSKASSDFEAVLREAKESSVGQLLFRAARLWNEQALERLRSKNPALRAAHAQLLPHIDLEGVRLTELARRVGATKQAVGELVDSLEAQGLLERVPDPSDRRAKLVRFTERGKKEILVGLDVLRAMEAEFAEELGRVRMERLGDTLRRLLALLERPRGSALP